MSIKATYEKMARPLGVRGQQKRSFLVASFKADREMFVESSCEHTTLLALDVDPRTVSILTQPFTVRLDIEKIFPTQSEARRHRSGCRNVKPSDFSEEIIYTPDFEVGLTDPPCLVVESKDGDEIARISAALKRREQILNNLGYRFLVVSNTEIEHKGLHNNLVNLRDAMKYRRKTDVAALLEDLTKEIKNRQSPFAFGEIRHHVSDLALYLGLIEGVIACDLRSGHFSDRTIIWPAFGDLTHLKLLRLGV